MIAHAAGAAREAGMASVAIFNSKGGVGKTTLAVNLAWEAARAGHRVLLWEMDEGGDSSWLMSEGPAMPRPDMEQVVNGLQPIDDSVHPSKYPGIACIAGDNSARRTDRFFVRMRRERRMVALMDGLKARFDVIVMDCSPGFSDANRQILMLADLVIVPTIPSILSMRGMQRVRQFLTRYRDRAHPPILPVFSMVDRRRKGHKAALAQYPAWPCIPMAAEIEQMADRRAPVGAFAPSGAAAALFGGLWDGVEDKLRKMRRIRAPRHDGPIAVPAPLALPA